MARLADLDELTLRCRSEAARAYIKEAVASYEGGALRSAIVATWIAVVFDLVDKIREASEDGGAAAQMRNEFERIQTGLNSGNSQSLSQALKWERELLDAAKSRLQLIDHHQLAELERLRDDRNRCAHPTFLFQTEEPFHPTPELVRSHLRHAVDHLLSQPPVQGRSLIDRIAAHIAGPTFPSTDLAAVSRQIAILLERPSEAALKGLVDKLVFGFIDQATPLHMKPGVPLAISALLELHRGVTEPRVAQQLVKASLVQDAAQCAAFCQLVGLVKEGWSLLSLEGRDRLIAFIGNCSDADAVRIGAVPGWNDDVLSHLETRMLRFSKEVLKVAVSYGVNRPAVKAAVKLYTNVYSWSQANSVYAEVIQPLVAYMEPEHIQAIVRAPRISGADLKGATSFSSFLTHVRSTGLVDPAQLDAWLKEEGMKSYIPVDPEEDEAA